jgi:hypothetical protein
MDLFINNPNPGPHFDAFGEPPARLVSSEGIIAQDVTQKFRTAAASLSTSLVLLGSTHADDSHRLQQPWSPASSSRMAILLCSSPWGPLR